VTLEYIELLRLKHPLGCQPAAELLCPCHLAHTTALVQSV
jgi:hypothetical protein